tara:strand:+ start:223 stop:1275 length:1053 start_codon:yes stop_codon:yes gene_type:complete
MSRSTVVVIGCGRIAQAEHFPAWRATAEAGLTELLGVCDLDEALARRAGEQLSVPWYTDTDVLFADTSPQIVDITTAVTSHRELCLKAFSEGAHVLCEKPIAMNVAEVTDILDAASEAGRLFSVCFQYRTWDEAHYVRDLLERGVLGPVHFIRTWGGGVHGFALHRRLMPTRGVLSHWTVHNLDLALWLLGDPEPLTASAFCHQRLATYPQALGPEREQHRPCEVVGDMEDFAYGMVRVEGNCVIAFEANWLQAPLSRPEGLELTCEKGTASVAPLAVRLDRHQGWEDETPPSGTLRPSNYRMDRLMTEFVEAVQRGTPPPVTASQVVRIQRLSDALYESAASHREIALS